MRTDKLPVAAVAAHMIVNRSCMLFDRLVGPCDSPLAESGGLIDLRVEKLNLDPNVRHAREPRLSVRLREALGLRAIFSINDQSSRSAVRLRMIDPQGTIGGERCRASPETSSYRDCHKWQTLPRANALRFYAFHCGTYV